MKKILIIFFLIPVIIVIFSKQLVQLYFSYKLSNWVEKKITFNEFNFTYPNLISINGLKIMNLNPIYYESIFEAEKVDIDFNLRSFLLDDLVIINHLKIEKAKFFLEIIEKKSKLIKSKKNKNVIFEDNIGLAKKINEDVPDKIWPIKKKDINFMILKSYINTGKAYIKVSSISEFFEIKLSDFKFVNVGNHTQLQHYKSVLKIMFFDIYSRIEDTDLKKLLKNIYNL